MPAYGLVSRKSAEHMASPFPPGFRGLDIDDQDMVRLDADTYGYATSVLKGPLTERQRAGLTRLTAVFDKVLPAIEDQYANKYYAHVRDIAVLAAEVEDLREK
ncbi:hypothetical protein [Streptomyces sp. HPF1205]|uniref:hypothetical protein n=1 Tax=Streptomyces sp. HPF1205 TaxID=2873262 RepID=UPI001CEDCE68|nr:hypothetical protein [Streptomyces sp. HPF1205]